MKEISRDLFTVKQWVAERDRYILEQKLNHFPTSNKGVLVIECEELKISDNSRFGFKIMVLFKKNNRYNE